MRFTILLVGACVLATHGCKDDLDSCAASRTCDPASSGGTSAGSPATAGRSGGTEAGGAAGMSEHAGETAGGASGSAGAPMDEGGAGGSTDELEGIGGVGLDHACDREGALSCQGPAQKLVLMCRHGIWEPQATCTADQNCDSTSGACAEIPSSCRGREPGETLCDGDSLVTCGADLVSTEKTVCEGQCDASTSPPACAAASCGDGKVQAPEACDDGNTQAGDGCSPACHWEVRDIVAGDYHTCALSEDGRVRCWGNNAEGELGRGNTENAGDELGEMGTKLDTVDLGTDRYAKSISAGARHTCALLDDGTVKCWGDNSSGQLGIGNTEARGDAPNELGDALSAVPLALTHEPASVAVGGFTSCVVFVNGSIKCWGDNTWGQLGLGDSDARGDAPGELGDDAINLGKGRWATELAVGAQHLCALLDNASVKCWGDNRFTELGFDSSGNNIGDAPSELGDWLAPVDFGDRTATTVALGRGNWGFDYPPFSCAALDDGSITCWGYLSVLGFSEIAASDKSDQLDDAMPQLTIPKGRTVKSLAAGSTHLCALFDNGTVQCWGNNDHGQIGYRSTPSVLDFGGGRKVIRLTAGFEHTCVLLDDRAVKCWGGNESGQLGYGDTTDRGFDSSELGDALPEVELGF